MLVALTGISNFLGIERTLSCLNSSAGAFLRAASEPRVTASSTLSRTIPPSKVGPRIDVSR